MRKAAWMAVWVLAGLMAAETNASGRQFSKAVYYRAGQRPYQVLATELTTSGNLDLVVANYLTDQIVVLLGNGDGTFQKPLRFSAPAPVALAAADFNGDGRLDLAVVEYGGTGESGVAIFLGNGGGRFRLSASYQSGVETTSVAVGDFNGDGRQDVAVANNAGDIRVFLGTGKGTLKKPSVYKIGDTPWAVAASDLNGDHNPDLAVTNLGGYVSILLNDGTGKFGKPVSYNAGGGEVIDVKIADLRNNGDQDLVIANGSRGMVILLNNGDGTFGNPTVYPPTCKDCLAPEACTVADFNLDGHLDVACVTNHFHSYFYRGKGNGKFGASVPINDAIQGNGGFSIAAGDFNNDQAPDLAIPIQNYGEVAILINTK